MKLRQTDYYLQSINKQIKRRKRKEPNEDAQTAANSAESPESLMHFGDFKWSGSCAVERPRATGRREESQTSSEQIQLFITSIFLAFIVRAVDGHEFASARFVYPRAISSAYRWPHSSAEESQSTTSKWSLHAKLAQLRRELDADLSANEGRQWALGSPCLANSDCNRGTTKAHCHNFTCACLPNHIQLNSTSCLPTSLLGYDCQVDAQCERRVTNSRCSGGKCACSAKFDTYRKDKCLPASKLDDYCLTNRQCQLNDRHAFCKWKIPNVYGVCKCPPNYKQIGMQKMGAGSEWSSANETQTSRCAPRLGDSCLDQADCLLATPNSQCRAPSRSDSLQTNWPTSSAGPKRCFCARGFVHSPNRLSCVKALSEESAHEVALESAAQMNSKTQYQLVINNANANAITNQSEQVSLLSSRTSEQESLSSSSGQLGAAKRLSASSLGKRCSSHNECRLRDSNSHCVSGRCECVKATERCNSNATNCHKDTFQCRNGQCISWYFVCDQFKNCDDGSDEDECQSSANSARTSNFECPFGAFKCNNGFQCVSRAKLCNGKRDCSDNSDESACPNNQSEGACHPQAFKCQNGQCLPPFVFCNAVQDCLDGSDESEALCGGQPNATIATIKSSQVGDSLLAKADRSTIDKMLASLANKPKRHSRLDWPPSETRECPKWAFTCRDGRCRSSAILCSGVDGCGDNSDEDKCEVCRCEAP